MLDILLHELDWRTNGSDWPESTTPICSCGWEGATVGIDDKRALEKMRLQWDDHMQPHMPTGPATRQ